MKILDFSTSNAQFTDEIINVPDSNSVELIHSLFYNKTGKLVEIWTGPGGTGTQLTETTDYVVGGAYPDADLPSSIAPDVAYNNISIVNATYHDTDLYISYYPLGDLITAEKWNNDIPAVFIEATGADYTFQKTREMRYNHLVLTFTRDATARTITLPDPTDSHWTGVRITIHVVGGGSGNVTLQGPSSEDIILTEGSTVSNMEWDGAGTLGLVVDGGEYKIITNGIWDSGTNPNGHWDKYTTKKITVRRAPVLIYFNTGTTLSINEFGSTSGEINRKDYEWTLPVEVLNTTPIYSGFHGQVQRITDVTTTYIRYQFYYHLTLTREVYLMAEGTWA